VPLATWRSIAWSGDGTMVCAAGNGNPIYSTTGGTFWTVFDQNINGNYISVSPNSNGSYVLIGGPSYPIALRRVPPNYNWVSVFPGSPVGLPNVGNSASYVCACSYTGDIQTALIQGTATPSAYISYNFGGSWLPETRFNATAFTGAAISSNGFYITVVGRNTKLQSLQYVTTTSPTSTIITLATTEQSKKGLVSVGSTGYEVTPFYKNIPGSSRFVWDTPTTGPPVFTQTTGPVSFSVPYASGFGTQDGYLRGYVLVNSTGSFDSVTLTSVPAGYNTQPTITGYTTGVASSQKGYVISAGNADILPGTYVASIGVNSAASKTNISVTVPLRAPTIISLAGQDSGRKINVTWSSPTLAPNTSSLTYSIERAGAGIILSNATGTSTQIPNTGATTQEISVRSVFQQSGIVSPRSGFVGISAPPPPTGVIVTGYATSTSINLSWDFVSVNSYSISYGGTLVTNITAVPRSVPLPIGSNIVIGVAAYSTNNLLSTFYYVSAFNRTGNIMDQGVTWSYTIFTPFIITDMVIVGGGGGGGSGGYGIGGPGVPPNGGLKGGGGGAQGGILRFSGGTGPQQPPSTITSYCGKAGEGGQFGGGGKGGNVSYLQITNYTTGIAETIASAGGGGGGGGGNGHGAQAGGVLPGGTPGAGGTGGSTGNIDAGGGGYGGQAAYFTTTITPTPLSSYVASTGLSGDTRSGTTGGKGGGPTGGGAAASGGGNFATGTGCGGGGGASAGGSGSLATASPRGGTGSDGSISISYCFLTT